MKIISMLITVGLMMFMVTWFLKAPVSPEIGSESTDGRAVVVDSAIDDGREKVKSNREEASKTSTGKAVLKRIPALGRTLDKVDQNRQGVLDEVNDVNK